MPGDTADYTNKMRILFCSMAALFCLAALTGCAALNQPTTTRAAVVGGISGYYGWTTLGRGSSESEAISLARSKGYSSYRYDSVTGIAYGK